MFTYQRTIYLRETDATGVLYFSEQLKLGLEALEAYFLSKGFTLQQMIEEADFLMPIVHAEADFIAPLRVGDQVEINLSLGSMGTSSFTLQTRIFDPKRDLEVGTTKIIHVIISKETGKSIPIPEKLQHFIKEKSLQVIDS